MRPGVGYFCVSTTEQKDDGISLDVQRERIVAYCKMFQHELIAIYSDDHTGRDINRSGFQSALARMVETDALLMSVSLDRISRRVGDWNHLLDTYFGKGGKYRFLAFDCAGMDPRTATGRMLLMMRAVIAQGEIDSTSERTQVAMDHLKAQGIPCGGCRMARRTRSSSMSTGGASSSRCPSRWRRSNTFGSCISRARASRPSPTSWPRKEDRRARARRGYSLRKIGEELTLRGLTPQRGGGWQSAQVRQLLLLAKISA
jgi:DNA invertase Pin-like site-specific DNA recombinase